MLVIYGLGCAAISSIPVIYMAREVRTSLENNNRQLFNNCVNLAMDCQTAIDSMKKNCRRGKTL